MTSQQRVTAAVMIIGDEILSGRTQDTNLSAIAKYIGTYGVDLAEARVVPDDEDEIVTALNHLRGKYDYVITTGGIGPTHDDITADCVAKAFGVGLYEHPEIIAMMESRWKTELNAARRRMARVPEGGSLVKNPVQGPPGFQIGNVFVMAGIPSVMQAMLEEVRPRLPVSTPLKSVTVSAFIGEGSIAKGLADLQKKNPDVPLGSYPFSRDGKFGTALVARGTDATRLEEIKAAFGAIMREAGQEPLPEAS